jgi:hypothetical protein
MRRREVVEGKRAVTLVATVLPRNNAVQRSIRLPVSIPSNTTLPDPMPIRLMTTCTRVKVMSCPIC